MTEGGKLCISRYPEPAVIELASIESDSDNLQLSISASASVDIETWTEMRRLLVTFCFRSELETQVFGQTGD